MKPPNYKEEIVVLENVSLSYNITECRQGMPWVFVHGTRDNKDVWEAFFDQYGDDHYLISVDLRGHGSSSKPDEIYTYDKFVEDLYALCHKLDLLRIGLVGHSLGGALSMYFAHKYPQMVEKLILMGCAATHNLNFKPETEGKSHGQIIDQMLPYFFPRNRKEVPESIINYVQKQIVSGWMKNITPVTHKRLNTMERIDLSDKIKDIDAKTILIFGELDGVATLDCGEFLRDSIDGANLRIIKDAGHFMFMERPNEVFKELDHFIDGNN